MQGMSAASETSQKSEHCKDCVIGRESRCRAHGRHYQNNYQESVSPVDSEKI